MITAQAKHYQDTVAYGFDWREWLNEEDQILASWWSVSPSGLIVADYVSVADRAYVWLQGGTAGVTYTVTNTIATVGGRVDQRSFALPVRNLGSRIEGAAAAQVTVAATLGEAAAFAGVLTAGVTADATLGEVPLFSAALVVDSFSVAILGDAGGGGGGTSPTGIEAVDIFSDTTARPVTTNPGAPLGANYATVYGVLGCNESLVGAGLGVGGRTGVNQHAISEVDPLLHTWQQDVEAVMRVTYAFSTATHISPLIRWDGSKGYAFQAAFFASSYDISLMRIDYSGAGAPTKTVLATATFVSGTLGQDITLRAVGSTVSILNGAGAVALSVTDSSCAGDRVGVWAYGVSSRATQVTFREIADTIVDSIDLRP